MYKLLKILCFSLTTFLILLVTTASAQKEGCGNHGTCKNCHTIENKEIQNILSKINIPNVKIKNISDTTVKGLWEVGIESNGQMAALYIDYAKKHIIVGVVIDIEKKENLTKNKIESLNKSKKVNYSSIPLKNSIILGRPTAPIKIFVFSDPECPYCAKLHTTLKNIVAKRKDIAFYIKMYPLEMHKNAKWQAESIICTKSLQMLEDAYNGKQIQKLSCKQGKNIIKDIKETAKNLNIYATPTIVFPNGHIISGLANEEEIIKTADLKN